MKEVKTRLLTYIKQKGNFFVCCAFVFYIAITFFVLKGIKFESNDDSAMAAILYGTQGGGHDSHLVFINEFIGKILCVFLGLFPNVPWYTVSQYALILVSLFVLFYLFACRFGTLSSIVPCCFFTLFFGWELLCNIQFSKTAGIAVTAGFLLLFDTLGRKKPTDPVRYIISILLIVVGSMYRFAVFEMLLIPMFGLGLYKVFEPLKKRQWKDVISIVLPFVVVFGLCFGMEAYDHLVYQKDREWSDYLEFNSLRSQLLDYGFPDYDKNRSLYESLDISEDDLEMYNRWDFADPERFTTEVLEKLVEAKEKTEFSKRNYLNFLGDLLSRYHYSCFLFIAVLYAAYSGKKQSLPILLYELIAFLGVETYLFLSGRYNLNRIDVPIFSSVCAVLMMYCWELKSIRHKALPSWVLALCILAVPFTTAYQPAAPQSQKVNELIASDKETLYFSTTGSGRPALIEPLTVLPEGHYSNLFSLGGWKTNMPIVKEALSERGIKNPFRDVVDNDKAYLLCKPNHIENRLSYIQRHYSPDAQAHLVKVIDSVSFYRISTHSPLLDTATSTPGENILIFGMSASDINGILMLDGYLVKEGINSYLTNYYIGITDDSGEERLEYLTQHELPVEDIMNGRYGGFTTEIPYGSTGDKVRLYLENGDELYHYDLGTVEEILQSGTTY